MSTPTATQEKGDGSEHQTGCQNESIARAGPQAFVGSYTGAPALTEDTHAHAQKPPPKHNLLCNLSKLTDYLSSITQSKVGKTYVYFPEVTAPDFALTSLELVATSPDGTALMATTSALHRAQGRRTDQAETSKLQLV